MLEKQNYFKLAQIVECNFNRGIFVKKNIYCVKNKKYISLKFQQKQIAFMHSYFSSLI